VRELHGWQVFVDGGRQLFVPVRALRCRLLLPYCGPVFVRAELHGVELLSVGLDGADGMHGG